MGTGFTCLAGRCTREILSGIFCGEHKYLYDGPMAMWAVRNLDEHQRELRGMWCRGQKWGFLKEVSRR